MGGGWLEAAEVSKKFIAQNVADLKGNTWPVRTNLRVGGGQADTEG